ncbi:MAG TPA: hypothetical protein VEW48_24195 [Thermoanaerobaculia bacterium]|nr:hypothetical protein [Thermoanaerobaculia bacterium]
MKNLIARTLCIAVLLLLHGSFLFGLEFQSAFDNIVVHARPGEVVNREFRLRLSPGQPTVHFRSRPEDWWEDEDGSHSFYRPAGTLSRSCAPWISLNPAETAVAGGGNLSIRVTVAVPAEAGPGGYWCVLTVDEIPDPLVTPKGVGLRFLSSISTGIFVDLAPVDRRIEVASVDLSQARARVQVRNLGNAPVAVKGRIEFLAPGGETPVASVALPRARVLTEPARTHTLTAKLPEASMLPDGRYRVRVILDAGLDHLIGVQKEMEIRHDAARPVR